MKFDISRTCLLLNVEYFGTNKLEFKNITASFTSIGTSGGLPSGQQSQIQGNVQQAIGTLNAHLGIGLHL